VRVRFRTDKIAPDTGTRCTLRRCGGWRLVVTTARSGRASGGNAAAIPHLSAAPFHISLRGSLTALWREGTRGRCARGGRLPPLGWVALSVRNGILRVKRLPGLPPLRHEELPPPRIAEERANGRGTNEGRPEAQRGISPGSAGLVQPGLKPPNLAAAPQEGHAASSRQEFCTE